MPLGNLLHCFHQGATNRETNSRVFFFSTLTHQIWEDLFLKAIKIICSGKQNLNLRDRNIKLDLSMIASVSYSNKLKPKDWNCRTLNTDTLNLDENNLDYKKNDL